MPGAGRGATGTRPSAGPGRHADTVSPVTTARTETTATRTPHVAACSRSPLGTFAECPQCGGELRPEHAHFRCAGCGWRDSCCD